MNLHWLVLLVSLLVVDDSIAHSGRTNSSGCHNNRRTGGYHCHNSGTKKRPKIKRRRTRSGKQLNRNNGWSTEKRRASTSVRENREAEAARAPASSLSSSARLTLGEYFRAANDNPGVLTCNVQTFDRDVPQSVKREVKLRDGHKCTVCGSRQRLEVDHRRALMNGGSNHISNLATLCHVCHLEKTRMDNSIRRKRRRLCRR